MIIDDIADRMYKRRERYEHFEEVELPDPEWIDDICFVGTSSICAITSQRRYLKKSSCIRANGHIETPSALARDYLAVKYDRGPRIRHEQYVSIQSGMESVPLYAKPTKFENGYYVDIKSCYWSIMSIVGWDVDYWPRQWISKKTVPDDFPWPEHKVARNCLVSAGLLSSPRMWSPDKGYFLGRVGNRFANLQLFRLITDVLRSVAWEAQKVGAVYVNNDGYIAADSVTAERITNIIRSWKLKPGIKAYGRGEVLGSGSYRFYNQRHVSKGKATQPINNLKEVMYAEWLKDSFTALAT